MKNTIYYVDDSFNIDDTDLFENELSYLPYQELINEYYKNEKILKQLYEQNLILKNQLATLKSEIHNVTNQKVDS